MPWLDTLAELIDVYRWPRKARHLFVWLLPVSGLLWICYVILFVIVMLILIVILTPVVFIADLWEGKESGTQ